MAAFWLPTLNFNWTNLNGLNERKSVWFHEYCCTHYILINLILWMNYVFVSISMNFHIVKKIRRESEQKRIFKFNKKIIERHSTSDKKSFKISCVSLIGLNDRLMIASVVSRFKIARASGQINDKRIIIWEFEKRYLPIMTWWHDWMNAFGKHGIIHYRLAHPYCLLAHR